MPDWTGALASRLAALRLRPERERAIDERAAGRHKDLADLDELP